jgi:flagellar hook-associated protein FlgK
MAGRCAEETSMTISGISNGAAGMQRASQQLEQSASRIARFGTGLEDVDLTNEMVNVMQAKTDFKANAKVIETARDMSRALLDIFV